MKRGNETSRRDLLWGAGALALGLGSGVGRPRPSAASPAAMQAAIKKVIGDAPLNTGRVTIEVPPLVENGNTVPCTVTVDSPMTERDYVRAIHIFNERNPQPNVFVARLSPRAGRASISTRIRLADTQDVVAIAELSDGSFWSARAHVVVTLPACAEEL